MCPATNRSTHIVTWRNTIRNPPYLTYIRELPTVRGFFSWQARVSRSLSRLHVWSSLRARSVGACSDLPPRSAPSAKGTERAEIAPKKSAPNAPKTPDWLVSLRRADAVPDGEDPVAQPLLRTAVQGK